jgi:hypothetical protein
MRPVEIGIIIAMAIGLALILISWSVAILYVAWSILAKPVAEILGWTFTIALSWQIVQLMQRR